MENTFRNKFGPILLQSNLEVKIFIWDDFHDRYLISDLVGIQMSNGFDARFKQYGHELGEQTEKM